MAKASFLFQAVTKQNHRDLVIKLLSLDGLEKAVISAAFVNVSGVNLLKEAITAVVDKLDVFLGIRNDITSYQAIEALLDIGVTVHVIDTGSNSLIFHPKVYAVRSPDIAHVAVGSANLTFSGLTNNIEASTILDLTLSNEDDKAFSDTLFEAFPAMLTEFPEHVFQIADKNMAKELLAEGRLIDEALKKPPSGKQKSANKKRDSLKTIGTYKVQKPAVTYANKIAPVPITIPGTTGTPVTTTTLKGFEIVWQSKKLIRRDLTIPSNPNSHQTGAMNWKQGAYSDIDQRHYFRDTVFAELDWEQDNPPYKELAVGNFTIIIKGIDHGSHDLTITHDTRTDTVNYIQSNCVTALRWGSTCRPFVAKEDLLGRIFTLYKSMDTPPKYVIDID